MKEQIDDLIRPVLLSYNQRTLLFGLVHNAKISSIRSGNKEREKEMSDILDILTGNRIF